MKTTADYVDALRAHFTAPSDYALHNHTGWHRQQISRYRQNKSSFDDATAEKVADWLSVPLEHVLIDMNAQRAKSARARSAWTKAAAATAAALVLAAALPALQPAAAFLGMYIMSN